jgi:periplasmic divalent cation tolerance protein
MDACLQIQTTFNKKEDALRISKEIVRKRLAACSQMVGPIRSIYWWKDQVEEAEEWLCLFKTRAELFNQVEKAIREAHPYVEPEIIAWPIARGSKSYLAWIEQETRLGEQKS